jgi:hypothetical protein
MAASGEDELILICIRRNREAVLSKNHRKQAFSCSAEARITGHPVRQVSEFGVDLRRPFGWVHFFVGSFGDR